MSRRKRNALPERLANERMQQLSWNMEINNRRDSLEHNNDSAVLSDSLCDVTMPNYQTTEIQNVYAHDNDDDENNDVYYYLKISNELFVDNSIGLLGCIDGVIDCLSSSGEISSIKNAKIMVKVHKTVRADLVTSDSSSELKHETKFMKVIATYPQIDSLEYLCKKGIVDVVAKYDDLVNQQGCKLDVCLNESGFSTVSVPSEDPSMGKIHKSMKILLQWIHGPWLPDVEAKLNEHYDEQIESVFSSLKSKQSCLVEETELDTDNILTSKEINRNKNLDELQHPSLVPSLRGYQKRAVHWMIEQETVDTKAFVTENKIPHPLWKEITVGNKKACYNPWTGRIRKDQIYHQGYPSGGILADEMGLGKTVEVLACILNNPRQSESKIEVESLEEIGQTDFNSSTSDSLSNSLCLIEEKEGSPNSGSVWENNHASPSTENSKTNEPQDQSLQNGFTSNSLPSLDQSHTEDSVLSNDNLAIETSNTKLHRPLETHEEERLSEVSKRSLPLDDDVTKPVKKSKVEYYDSSTQNSIVKSPPSSNCIPADILNKSPLQSDLITSDPTQREQRMECNDFPTELPQTNQDDIIPQSVQEMESTEVQRENKSPITVEKEKLVRCICGKNKVQHSEEILTCTNCSFSQHPQCIGVKKTTEDSYVCPDCSVKMPLLESNTTLIVSPVTIAHQWLDEIHRHILPGSLNVMVYEGVAKQGFIYPSVLADNDVILTTYEVLKRDFHHLPSQKDRHSHRRPKRYSTWPCPLTCIKFWRICLDEAQMVENTTAKTTETALNLSAVHRWCITGTPIQKSIEDLHGLFLFLGVEPYYRRTWWKKLLYEPFMKGNSKPLSDVLYSVMWRTVKKDVIDEINLPEQKESMNWLNFSPVEYHFYRRQYEECSRSALKELNKFQESETELNSLDRYSVHKVLWPLLRLRQACCHPQAVRGGYLAIQKNVITMDQLLESLINKAKNESQDAHRQLLCALNGLAGTYVLQENLQSAVDVYREAMASWKEHEELLKTDSLQKLHTLHNLHEILNKFNSSTRTLNDDFLQREASEIKDKYLQRWKDQVRAAESEAHNAWRLHDELKQKVDLNCPWWMTYVQNIIKSENPADVFTSERLVDKIKSDLTAVRNVQESGHLSMADSFSNLRGLQLVLVQKFEAIEDCQENLFQELKSLMIEPTKTMVESAAECCLRPAINSTFDSCCFCRVNDVLSVYESLIFGHQGMKNNDPESIGGLRAETEAVRTLKSMHAFLKSESKRHYKYHEELQQQAQCHLEYLDLIKKNFKVYRQLWHALRQRVSALDELAMCTMRLRLRYPGEVVPENQFYIVEPTGVETAKLGFRSDKTLANSSLRKCLGQLLYLKNLAKTQSTDGGENSELCPVCTKVLGYEWSVFSCGHCLCCQCMWVLLERPNLPGRAGSYVRCPMCRANSIVQDISYVSTIRQLTAEDKDLVVKGSHSTKIEAAVRTLMKIQRTDPHAKTLVFSTWQDVLDVISRALAENNMKFRSIKKSKDFQSSLEEFKTQDDIPILLIPLQSGSNGLNIIEATHVILVEPSLNPSLERQAVGRIHRIGQTKATFIHRLLIANTVEEKILRFVQNKVESGMRCGTRRTDKENVPLTVGELASFFQPTES